jgi:trigger factor
LKATTERASGSRVVLDVEVPPEEMAPEIEAATRRIARRARIPGFRPGRAPLALVERAVGRPRILEEALRPLVARAYEDAVRQEGLEPIAQPSIEVRDFADGEPLHFVATVPVRPEVVLGDYAAVTVPVEPAPVEDAAVERALEELRKGRGVWVPRQEPAADGDLVVLDVTVRLSQGRTRHNRAVEAILGSGRLRPEVEAAVRGLSAGAEAEVELTFPADDPSPELRGQAGHVRVEVREVKRLQLPELDDAFAREVSSADTVEELRLQVRNRLRREAERAARQQALQEAVRIVVDGAQLELPEVLVEETLGALVGEAQAECRRVGLAWEAFLASREGGEEGFRASLRPAAEREARTRVVLMALARAVGLWPTEAEVDAEVDLLAPRSGMDPAHFRRLLEDPDRRAGLRAQMGRRRALHWIAEHCLPAEQREAALEEAEGGELGRLLALGDAGPDPQADGPSGPRDAEDGGAAG